MIHIYPIHLDVNVKIPLGWRPSEHDVGYVVDYIYGNRTFAHSVSCFQKKHCLLYCARARHKIFGTSHSLSLHTPPRTRLHGPDCAAHARRNKYPAPNTQLVQQPAPTMTGRRLAIASLVAAAPAAAWPGIRGPCLRMTNVAFSSSCDAVEQQKTTHFSFTMEKVRLASKILAYTSCRVTCFLFGYLRRYLCRSSVL